jgi:SPP1 gp7 family putative phage head morphogenesis protein
VLVRDVGLPMAAAHLYERFGIPAPGDGEAIVTPKTGGGAAAPGEAAQTATDGGTPHKSAVPLARCACGRERVLVLADRGAGDSPTTDPDKLDALVSEATTQSYPAMDAMVAVLASAIDRAGNLEQLRTSLLEAYIWLKPEGLADALARAVFVANLQGRRTDLDVRVLADRGPASVDWKPLPFAEAQAYFRGKVVLPKGQFEELIREARDRAWTVSGIARLDLLQDVYTALDKAISQGTTAEQFRKDISGVLEAQGWTGREHRWRVETIFRTNVLTAYSAGHHAQMKESGLPYWQYDAVGDSATRPSHAAMDGKVFRADDPIWDTWYPPNGFNCRCTVRAMGETELRARGLQVENGEAFATVSPDKGFDHAPGGDWVAPLAAMLSKQTEGKFVAIPGLPGPAAFGRPAYAQIDQASLPPRPAALDGARPADIAGAVKAAFGEGGIRSATGDLVIPSQQLVKHLEERPDHAPALGLLPDLLERPFEVWNVPYTDGKRVVFRQRYITLWRTEGHSGGALVVVETHGPACEAITMYPASGGYLDGQRTGGLLFPGVKP